jgi:hypothetical protein
LGKGIMPDARIVGGPRALLSVIGTICSELLLGGWQAIERTAKGEPAPQSLFWEMESHHQQL